VPVGGLSYRAHYNGSTTYNGSTSACEPLDASKLDSSTATDIHKARKSTRLNSTHDQTSYAASSSTNTAAGGIPTGDVTFSVWLGIKTCPYTSSIDPATVNLDPPSFPTRRSSDLVPVGGLSYRAHYNGSTTYNGSTSACEPLDASKLDSSTATDIH